MDEVLKKIFESEVLTEDTKTELKEAFSKALTEAVEEARTKAEADVKAELAEQFIVDKEKLIEALDTKAEEVMSKEFEELREDVQRFRDLEVEHAEKLVEARAELAEVVKKDFAELIEGLDAFLEEAIQTEFAELKEELEDARKREFGKKIFEGFAKEYRKHFQDGDETLIALEESKATLQATTTALQEAQKELKAIKHSTELNKVLEPLQGRPREVMEAILKNVSTEKLSEKYEAFIGRVLHENAEKVEEVTEKESGKSPVLAESNTSTEINGKSGVKTVNGDNKTLKEGEESLVPRMSEESLAKLKKLAGIN